VTLKKAAYFRPPTHPTEQQGRRRSAAKLKENRRSNSAMKTKGIRLNPDTVDYAAADRLRSSHEVNTIGLTVCIGIDKSDGGYRISEQVSTRGRSHLQRATK
jgi:RIO-like serine/threonine protein kinase